jgi:hypothetical protein
LDAGGITNSGRKSYGFASGVWQAKLQQLQRRYFVGGRKNAKEDIMAIEQVREINREWEAHLIDCEYSKSFWLNEPFSDDYWREKYKIVFCNLEAYGDAGEADHTITLDKYKSWLGLGIPTPKFSALFIYCLYKKLQNIDMTEDQLSALFHNNDELLSIMKNTTYMNLRKEENWKGSKLDEEEIYRFLAPGWPAFKTGDTEQNIKINEYNRNFTLDFIDALEPDIFIVTGKVGQDVLNKMYEGKIDLPWQGMYKSEKTLYVSITHPSRIGGYEYILERTNDICKEIGK